MKMNAQQINRRRIMLAQLNTEERLLGRKQTKRFVGDNRKLRAKLDRLCKESSQAFSTMRW